MAGKKQGGNTETEDGIAPGLLEFEKELGQSDGDEQLERVNPPDPESMLEDPPPEPGVKDDEPTEKPAEEPAKAEETTLEDGEAAPVADDEPTSSESSDTQFKVPDHDFYGAFRGRDMTAKQLEEAGLLDKILTGAHQVSHFQKLHEESKSEMESLKERLSKVETPPEPEKEVTPQEFAEFIDSSFKPVVDEMVKNGLIEEDFHIAYPKAARLAEFRVKAVLDQFAEYDEKIKKIEESIGPWRDNEQETRAVSNVATIVRDLVTEEENLMGGLKDDETQKEFFAFLADTERSGARFTPYDATKQDIRGAYLSFLIDKGSEIPSRAPAGDGETQQKRGQRGMTGTGGQARGRGAAPVVETPDEIAQLEADFMRSQESRFD